MTAQSTNMQPESSKSSLYALDPHLKRRKASERRFKLYGIAAIAAGLFFLCVLLFQIIGTGAPAFTQTFINVPVYLDPAKLDKKGTGDIEDIKKVTTFGYTPLIQKSLLAELEEMGIESGLEKAKDLKPLISPSAAGQVRDYVLAHPETIGETVDFKLLAASNIDGYMKGRVTRESISRNPDITNEHLALTDTLIEAGGDQAQLQPAFHLRARCLGPASGTGRLWSVDPRLFRDDDRGVAGLSADLGGGLDLSRRIRPQEQVHRFS